MPQEEMLWYLDFLLTFIAPACGSLPCGRNNDAHLHTCTPTLRTKIYGINKFP